MEKEKELSINYSKEVKDFIKNKQKVIEHLNEFQGFMPTDMVRVYQNDLNNFVLDKMSTSLKISADVFVDDKKLEKWAKMCMALENMTKEEIEDIAVRHYVEKLENKMNNKLAKYERAFEILKDNINMELICADYDFLCKSLYALDVYANKQIELTKKEAEVFGELLNGEEDK